MSASQIFSTLLIHTDFEASTILNIHAATMRARRYMNVHGLAAPRRIVLRPNGVVRAEINSGKVKGGILVAVVNR